jgi:hypothetical protein
MIISLTGRSACTYSRRYIDPRRIVRFHKGRLSFPDRAQDSSLPSHHPLPILLWAHSTISRNGLSSECTNRKSVFVRSTETVCRHQRVWIASQ